MKNKIIYLLLLVIVIEGLFFAIRPNLSSIRTDSGWDSSYSSSDSSSSSWDSSSSYSSSSSSSSSSSKSISDYTITEVIFFECSFSIFMFAAICYGFGLKKILYSVSISMVRFIIAILLELYVNKSFFIITIILFYPVVIAGICFGNERCQKNKKVTKRKHNYKDITLEELNKYGIDSIDVIKDKLFDIFVDVQNAWMEFDYDKLSMLCGNELYNSYKSDLEVLKLKNGKNIMSDYKCIDIKIYDIKEKNNNIDLYVYLNASFHDYVINTESNKVIRGNKNNIMNNHYELVFRKNNKVSNKCPSCGAEIKNNNGKCSHCGNLIVNNNSDYVLIKKGIA